MSIGHFMENSAPLAKGKLRVFIVERSDLEIIAAILDPILIAQATGKHLSPEA